MNNCTPTNLDEMGKSLETYKICKLTPEEIDISIDYKFIR